MISNIQDLTRLGKHFGEVSDMRLRNRLPAVDFEITTNKTLSENELALFLAEFDGKVQLDENRWDVQRMHTFQITFKVDFTQEKEVKWKHTLRKEETNHPPVVENVAIGMNSANSISTGDTAVQFGATEETEEVKEAAEETVAETKEEAPVETEVKSETIVEEVKDTIVTETEVKPEEPEVTKTEPEEPTKTEKKKKKKGE